MESSYVHKIWGGHDPEPNLSKDEIISKLINSTDTKKKLNYLASQMQGWVIADLAEGISEFWYIIPIFRKAAYLNEYAILIDMHLKLTDMDYIMLKDVFLDQFTF